MRKIKGLFRLLRIEFRTIGKGLTIGLIPHRNSKL